MGTATSIVEFHPLPHTNIMFIYRSTLKSQNGSGTCSEWMEIGHFANPQRARATFILNDGINVMVSFDEVSLYLYQVGACSITTYSRMNFKFDATLSSDGIITPKPGTARAELRSNFGAPTCEYLHNGTSCFYEQKLGTENHRVQLYNKPVVFTLPEGKVVKLPAQMIVSTVVTYNP